VAGIEMTTDVPEKMIERRDPKYVKVWYDIGCVRERDDTERTKEKVQ